MLERGAQVRHNRQCKDPCDGCGRTDQYRKKDQLCYDCKELLTKAYKRLDLKKNPAGKITVLVPEASHWMEYIEHPGSANDPRGPLHRLALCVGEIVPAKGQVKTESLADSCDESSCHPVVMDRDVFTALKEVIDTVRDCVPAAYRKGRVDGSNLLNELASGEISVRELNDKTTEA